MDKTEQERLQEEVIRIRLEEFVDRSKTGDWIQYLNGNTICEINKKDGTFIMSAERDFDLAFPVNIDINISNRCKIGCPFCYQRCTPTGAHADIRKYLKDKESFLYSLHEGTELAINGNEPLHPDLLSLLEFCRDRNIFANLTLNEHTYLAYREMFLRWQQEGLIHGIGISPKEYSDELLKDSRENQNMVIHTIAGVTTVYQYTKLIYNHSKILILGYKDFGRGTTYKKNHPQLEKDIVLLQQLLKFVSEGIPAFISFDNLAIEQLDAKNTLGLSDEEYAHLYRGDDGGHTMFIDLVKETYSVNSIQPASNHLPIKGTIEQMFKKVKAKAKKLQEQKQNKKEN